MKPLQQALRYFAEELKPYYKSSNININQYMETLTGHRDLEGAPEGYEYKSVFDKYFVIQTPRNLRSKSYYMDDKMWLNVPSVWRWDGPIESRALKQGTQYPIELDRRYIYNDKTVNYRYKNYKGEIKTREWPKGLGLSSKEVKTLEPYMNQDMIILTTGHGNTAYKGQNRQTVCLEINWSLIPNDWAYWRVGMYINKATPSSTIEAKFLIHHSKTKVTGNLPAGTPIELYTHNDLLFMGARWNGTEFTTLRDGGVDSLDYTHQTIKLTRPEGMAYTYIALEIDTDFMNYDGSCGILCNCFCDMSVVDTYTYNPTHHRAWINPDAIPKVYSGINQFMLKKMIVPSFPRWGDILEVYKYIDENNIERVGEYMCTGPHLSSDNNGQGYWNVHRFAYPLSFNEDLFNKLTTSGHDGQRSYHVWTKITNKP